MAIFNSYDYLSLPEGINLRVILQDLLPPWIQPSWDAGWQQNAGRIWLDRCAKELWTLKSHIRVITLCRTAPFLPKSESLEWSQLKHLVKKCQEVEPKDISNLCNMLLLHHVTMLYPLPQDSVTIKVIQKAGNTLQLTKNLSWVGIGRQLSKKFAILRIKLWVFGREMILSSWVYGSYACFMHFQT
jgi:hypothetical protein